MARKMANELKADILAILRGYLIIPLMWAIYLKEGVLPA